MDYRPFRFGVMTANAPSHTAWVEIARKAEGLGYSTLLAVDHVDLPIAPLTALAVAAEATTTLRIGSLVFCNDFRHPALLAKEAAMLDLLSNGRFELGLGPGYMETDYTCTGLTLDKPGQRISRFEEALTIIKRFFTEETVNFKGNYYRITDLPGLPKALQKPHPPIYIGGGGRRMLSLAGREAAIVGIKPINSKQGLNLADAALEGTAQKVAWVREAAGERFPQLELSCTLFRVTITDGPQSPSTALHSPPIAQSAAPQQALNMIAGSRDAIVDELLRRREQYNITYIQIMQQQMEEFAPIMARLQGR
jgi:probable F420-dependent oxidoreductase